MLDFFRTYQRYFFFVITVMIVISFSFFGTYNSVNQNPLKEQTAFTSIEGKKVSRRDVDDMAIFLATDNEDKIFFGGAWGLNFLNDGVIRKDFLETGIGQQIALAYKTELQSDFEKRLQKEKKYIPYTHPQAPFLSVENIWKSFAPQMYEQFTVLKNGQDALDPQVLDARVQLFLQEKQLPSSLVRAVLRHQEKQNDWIKPDERLQQTDLSLFGYHTLEDWFGPQFTRLLSQFIINTAELAEANGYQVSKAEALTDLLRNAQTSYKQNSNNPQLGVTSAGEYFEEQLRRLNIDQAQAVKIWRDILLFRKYFEDVGATALLDPMASKELSKFANENVSVSLYQMPAAFQIKNYDDLQKLHIYLQSIAKKKGKDPLAMPDQIATEEEVAKKFPELVQKKYDLLVSKVTRNVLQSRIGLRELWNAEVQEDVWKDLTKQFPLLGVKEAKTREERFEALDSLDTTTRKAVDTFAKQLITKAHPEWIDEALDSTQPEKMSVGLRLHGGTMPFSGLEKQEKRKAFLQLLDEASLGEEVIKNSPLYHYTADDQTFYRIAVIDRANGSEILSFAEASIGDTLDHLRNRLLKKYYAEIREKNPSLYQNKEGEWKAFSLVKNEVADAYFEKVLLALDPIYKQVTKEKEKPTKDQLAIFLLYPYINGIKEKLVKDPDNALAWISSKELMNENPSLLDQWKIQKSETTFSRNDPQHSLDMSNALDLSPGDWSTVQVRNNGDLSFFQRKEHGNAAISSSDIAEQIRNAQQLLGNEARRIFASHMLAQIKEKNAMSLAYLQIPRDEIHTSTD